MPYECTKKAARVPVRSAKIARRTRAATHRGRKRFSIFSVPKKTVAAAAHPRGSGSKKGRYSVIRENTTDAHSYNNPSRRITMGSAHRGSPAAPHAFGRATLIANANCTHTKNIAR